MSLSIVQSTFAANTEEGGEITFTLGADPTPGNYLVAFLCYVGGGASTPPNASWVALFPSQNYATETEGWAYEVQSGDGETWVWDTTEDEWNSGYLFEVTGCESYTEWQVSYQAPSTDAPGTVITTPAVEPDTTGMLGLTFCALYDPVNLDSVTSGWTSYTQAETQTNQASVAASLNALTSGDSDVDCTYTFASEVEYINTVTLLVTPVPAPPAAPVVSFVSGDENRGNPLRKLELMGL